MLILVLDFSVTPFYVVCAKVMPVGVGVGGVGMLGVIVAVIDVGASAGTGVMPLAV